MIDLKVILTDIGRKRRKKRKSEGTIYEPVKSKVYREKIRNDPIIFEN